MSRGLCAKETANRGTSSCKTGVLREGRRRGDGMKGEERFLQGDDAAVERRRAGDAGPQAWNRVAGVPVGELGERVLVDGSLEGDQCGSCAPPRNDR
jgi:hypothetical protein